MRRIVSCLVGFVSTVGLLLAQPPPAPQARSADFLMGQALHQEQSEGNLQAATATYTDVLAITGLRRQTAARAQVRLGLCYERLGRQEAMKAFEAVLARYPEQADAAAEARAGLIRLSSHPANGHPPNEPRVVWSDPDDLSGSPSPDGRRLSFNDGDTGNLAIVELATGTTRALTTTGKLPPNAEYALNSSVWSPDGNQIAYTWYNGERFMDLRIVTLATGLSRVVVSKKELRLWKVMDWSRDSKDLLCQLGKETGYDAGLVSVADGTIRRVVLPQDCASAGRLSPDGRHIAYQHQCLTSPTNADISVVAVDSGEEQPIVRHAAFDQSAGWTPPGSHVLFLSRRHGGSGLWTLEMDGGRPRGEPRLLKENLGRAIPMGLTADGSLFYWTDSSSEDVYLAALDFSSGHVLRQPEAIGRHLLGANSAPAWSPDGTRLAYLSTLSTKPRSTPPEFDTLSILWPSDGRQRTLTTGVRLSTFPAPRWSVDGRSVLASGRNASSRTSAFYRVDADTGDAHTLADNDGSATLLVLNDERTAAIHAQAEHADGASADPQGHLRALAVPTGPGVHSADQPHLAGLGERLRRGACGVVLLLRPRLGREERCVDI